MKNFQTVSFGGSYWYKERCGRDGNQVLHNPVEHVWLELHPSFLKSIPMEICQHQCHADSPFIITFHKPCGSLLHHFQFVDITLTIRVPYTGRVL